MTVRLQAVAGPLTGSSIPIPQGTFTIGRDTANTLCIAADDRVSRRHAVIEADGGQYLVRHVAERTRTYVNQQACREALLEHGDELRVGESVFIVVDGDRPLSKVGVDIDLDEGAAVGGATRTIRHGDALFPDRETLFDALPIAARSDRLITAVLKACRAVLGARRLADLQSRLLEAVVEAVPADRAAVVMGRDLDRTVTSACYWTREEGAGASFRIPGAVIRQVMADRTAVAVNEASYAVWSSQTMAQAALTSIVAIPLLSGDDLHGVFYLDVANPRVRIGEDDLRLLTGVVEVASLPLINAAQIAELEAENERLLAASSGDRPLVGVSEKMRAVHRFVGKVAGSDSTVLIWGPSGTGKELVARAVHRASSRTRKPFVAINCAAVTETLLESEFFGHEKGAFTGAYTQKKGKFEDADGGTVFLDEIGELALPLQAKLLRVLQEREFERVGGNRPVKVNVRVVAATNRNLEQEVRKGTFRQDLFYRLNVVAITLPSLSERIEDIPLLAVHFLRKHSAAGTRRITGISPAALACLTAHDWPGNIRELENVIERAIVLGTTEEVLPEDLPESMVRSVPGTRADSGGTGLRFHETIREFKKQLVSRALEEAGGSYAEAARRLGLHANNLHRLMKTLDLREV